VSGYLVQVEELGKMIDDLTHAAERIAEANKRLRDATAEALGHESIDSAGKSFQERWEHGTKKIAEAAEKMVEGLEQTRNDYLAVEAAVAQMFTMDGAGDAPTPGGSSESADGAIARGLEG